jgi:hypothetical protein
MPPNDFWRRNHECQRPSSACHHNEIVLITTYYHHKNVHITTYYHYGNIHITPYSTTITKLSIRKDYETDVRDVEVLITLLAVFIRVN